ncbi:MAG: alpha-L-rhamnosidase N-terminal domain-containing protein, partial [Tepidisphaeraceae bacterium]
MPPKPVLPLSAPSRLRCEYFENPIGLDEPSPRLAWENADRQAAYQIRVASDASGLAQDDADVWKSDRVKSGANVQVAYGGPKLKSRRRYYWSVRVWDAKGRASPWSEAGWWEMGLLAPKDWQARWVADAVPRQAKERGPSPYLRRAFVLRGAVARARVYVTALGLYEMWINGRRVGADSFTPGWTDYSTRVQYQTYDVTDLLRDGDNVVGAILGDGWYCGDLGWELARPPYGNEPSLRAQLEITYTNGSTETIATDRSWKTARGAILANDFYHGETHDARLEPVGWNAPGFGDAGWQ